MDMQEQFKREESRRAGLQRIGVASGVSASAAAGAAGCTTPGHAGDMQEIGNRLDGLHGTIAWVVRRLHDKANRLYGESPPQSDSAAAGHGNAGELVAVMNHIENLDATVRDLVDACDRLDRLV